MMYHSSRWLVRVAKRSVSVSAVPRITSSLREMARPRCVEVVFLDEARPEALQLGVVPQHVGLVVEVDAHREPLLDEQRFADLLQEVALRAARQVPLLQRLGDFLDAVEGDRDAPLVVGEGDAHRQRLGDEQQPVVVGRLDLQVARGRQLRVLVRLDDQPHGLRLALGQRLDDALGEAADQRLLVDRVHADEHRGARLEEDGDALAAGAEGEGDAGEGVLALQPLDVDALAELQRPDV